MITFNFNGIDFSDYFSINEISGRGIADAELETLSVRGRHGTFLLDKKYSERVIEMKITVKGNSLEDLRDRVDELNILLHKRKEAPLVFSDEPDRTYYAVLTGGNDLTELRNFGQGTLTFRCPDPLKYTPEVTRDFVNDVTVIQNRGAEPMLPIFRATALQDISYMNVFTETDYMQVGQPPEDGQDVFSPEDLMFHSPMNNLTGWTAAGTAVDGGTVLGAFGSHDDVFEPNDYGVAAETYHGPALKQSVPGAPLADFRIEFEAEFPYIDGTYGRTEVYFLDDNSNAIGKFGIVRRYHHPNTKIEVRVGGGSNYTFPVNYYGGPRRTEWNGFDGIIRMSRKGNVYDIYIAKVDPSTGKHSYAHSVQFIDEDNKYLGNLSQVQVHTATWGEQEPAGAEIKDLKVYRLNEVPAEDPRIIAKAGDVIEIDHNQSAIFINGEERKDLKDFGATFFDIPTGDTAVVIGPPGAFEAEVITREAYL